MSKGPIGIIGAMDVEVADLVSWLEDAETREHAGTTFVSGRLEGVDVVVLQCGIGKVNAAIGAQALCDFYQPSAVINTGVAGAIAQGLKVLDVVVSRDALYHDFDVRPLGYEIGQIPDFAVRAFPADRRLIDAATAAAHAAMPESQVVEGRILSGDVFVNDAAQKEQLARELGGACCEMEGTSIAHVAYVNGIPYVVIRAISDNADGSPAMDYREMEPIAANKCAEITRQMVAALG